MLSLGGDLLVFHCSSSSSGSFTSFFIVFEWLVLLVCDSVVQTSASPAPSFSHLIFSCCCSSSSVLSGTHTGGDCDRLWAGSKRPSSIPFHRDPGRGSKTVSSSDSGTMLLEIIFLGVLPAAPWLLGTEGSSAPTAWPLRCRPTWNWRDFPPWRTRVFSSEAPSGGTLSPARPHSTGRCARCARRACSVTGRTTGPPAGLPAHTLNPGWSNPVWRALTRAERPPFAGTAAGSCNSFTMKASGWKVGARRWRERQRRTTSQRRVSGLRSFLPDYLFYWFFNNVTG